MNTIVYTVSLAVLCNRFPITINLGFPKSGSSSFHMFMTHIYTRYNSSYKSCHWRISGEYVCEPLRRTYNTSGNPLRLLPNTCRAISQADCETFPEHIFFPQISMAEQLMAQLPHARFVLPTRNSSAWIRSIKAWGMYDRIVKANLPGAPPGKPLTPDGMKLFQQEHYSRIRKLAKLHSAHLFEFDIEHVDANALCNFLGVSADCTRFWGHHNQNTNAH